MINIKWDKKYSVGHERIDHEHQVFLDLIRNVSLAEEKKFDKDRGVRLLREVLKYAEFHFYSEENIMLDHGYPDYEGHKQEHTMLLAQLDDKIHGYSIDSVDLSELVDYMFTWFALHTTNTDKKMALYIGED
jgi:hemerythrin